MQKLSGFVANKNSQKAYELIQSGLGLSGLKRAQSQLVQDEKLVPEMKDNRNITPKPAFQEFAVNGVRFLNKTVKPFAFPESLKIAPIVKEERFREVFDKTAKQEFAECHKLQ